MISPLIRVLDCLLLKFLESDPFKCIIPKDSLYFRCIGNILYIYIFPRNNDLIKITDKLNKIEPPIDFTNEQETYNTLLLFRYIIDK